MDSWTFTCCSTTHEIDNSIRHACCPYCGLSRDRAVYRRNQTQALNQAVNARSLVIERAVRAGFRNALISLAMAM